MSVSTLFATDKYKMVMAEAGFPLRRETFVFNLRKGGPWIMPVDPVAFIQSLLADIPDPSSAEGRRLHAELASQGMPMSGAFWEAMAGEVEVIGVPKGAWFPSGAPALTITGPSALVSNLEARLIGALAFRIQVATLAVVSPEQAAERLVTATCAREREIILESLDAVDVPWAHGVHVDSTGYANHIRGRAANLLRALDGDASRAMEAGYRAASCLEQHLIAAEATRDAGFRATSNVEAARVLSMIPAGTTGHEHTQRWGSDYAAFTAVRDMVAGEVTYLLDTYGTLNCGLPTALRVMNERPDKAAAVRFDSESTMDNDVRVAAAVIEKSGHRCGFNLGGGFGQTQTEHFEAVRRELGWAPDRFRYLYGQYLVQPHVSLPTRGDVGAVLKLSETGGRATMKFSDNPAKSSSPGQPVLWRARPSAPAGAPLWVVAQAGETVPADYALLSGHPDTDSPRPGVDERPVNSAATAALVHKLTTDRQRQIEEASR